MTPTEINRRLALAIGYAPVDVGVYATGDVVVRHSCSWMVFDYRSAETIYPIAEKYRMFPEWSEGNLSWLIRGKTLWCWNTCPRECIALAVIEAHERG